MLSRFNSKRPSHARLSMHVPKCCRDGPGPSPRFLSRSFFSIKFIKYMIHKNRMTDVSSRVSADSLGFSESAENQKS